MTYLLDTKIISEVRKGRRCDAAVAVWYDSIGDDDLYLSTLVLGEIRRGIESAREHDPMKAASLERWLGQVEAAFGARILPSANDLTLVTRSDRDVTGLGARVLNPFQAARPA